MNSDDSFWNWLREDAAIFRTQQWTFQPFQSAPALFSKTGEWAQPYNGEPYDSEKWDLRQGGWDHAHCRFCNLHICDAEECSEKAFQSAYVSDNEWLCPTCFERIIQRGEDPEIVLGWQ